MTKINEDIIAESIKAPALSFSERRDKELRENNPEKIKEITSKMYALPVSQIEMKLIEEHRDLVELALKDKFKDADIAHRDLYFQISLNFHTLYASISSIVNEVEGMTCSADKGRHILKSLLKYARYGKARINEKGYWNPNIHSLKLWVDIVRNHPAINTRKNFEYVKHLQKYRERYYKHVMYKRRNAHQLYQYLHKNHQEVLDSRIGKERKRPTFRKVFTNDFINGLDWLKYKRPEIYKQYKHHRKNQNA